MIEQQFNELRSILQQTENLPEGTRTRLLQLADDLERQATAAAAAGEGASPDDASSSSEDSADTHGLVTAIEGLEASHPELTAAVSNTASMLSKLGF